MKWVEGEQLVGLGHTGNLKVRRQAGVMGDDTLGAAGAIWREEGLAGFYPGGSAIAARQASNWASRVGFTEAVRIEMLMAKAPVQVVVVHPGGVATNIARANLAELGDLAPAERARAEARLKVYEEKLLKMPPATAARTILDGVARGRSRIVVTRAAVWLDRFVRLLPERYPTRVAAAQAKLFPD